MRGMSISNGGRSAGSLEKREGDPEVSRIRNQNEMRRLPTRGVHRDNVTAACGIHEAWGGHDAPTGALTGLLLEFSDHLLTCYSSLDLQLGRL